MSAHPSRTPGVVDLTGENGPYWRYSPLSYAQGIATVCDFLLRFASTMRQQRAYLANRIANAVHDPRDPEHVITVKLNRDSAERHLRNLGLAVDRADALARLLQTNVGMQRKRERQK